MDAFYDVQCTAQSVCSVSVFEVPVEMSESITLRSTGLAAVQVRYGLGFVAMWAESNRSTVSSLAYTDA
jgi:hypothetical protein